KGVSAVLPLDAVAEFVIKTSVPGADSGLGTAQVQMAMKSGTNQFHGSLYEFFRGNLWDARDFFNPTGQKAHLVRNQFGGSVGGRIIRDRTFFYLSLEAARIRTAANSRLTVPTLDMRNGILS